ncbi:MAG: 4-alpha-glucanotransferase [Lachnospiraceae bacterium]|nr:4-alpha-glucanotransferase [Lachnospiraceae bacterium]
METEKKWERSAGILMPISSLPGPYGIGTLGKEAFDFVDFAREMEYSYWQVLPVGPTGYGDSPYQSFSAFAGNPYFIDLSALIEEGLLSEEDCDEISWGESEERVDYGALYEGRREVLHIAYRNSGHKGTKAFSEFCERNDYWLKDYAMFMAIKDSLGGLPWQEWKMPLRLHKAEALAEIEEELSEEIDYYMFCQFKFDEQWKLLHEYAEEKGIAIIGDIPLYMALDSADVWAHYDLFELDARRREINIAGVPPDLFSATGQRWGNPLYRWNVMERQDFAWWKERMAVSAARYDVIRIDHFIGIVNYYSIPAESETALKGEWKKGPGEKLTRVINEAVGDGKIIAEDLGVITQPVVDLMKQNEYPGMKILEFALDCTPDNPYLPHNFTSNNSIAYIGTHDNETLCGYLSGRSDWDMDRIREYFGIGRQESVPDALIRAVYRSSLHTAIFQMQDLLGLGNEARMNFPSTLGENWQWRMTKEQYDEIDIQKYQKLAWLYRRENKN